jgi:chromosome segregation ATPase
MDSVYKLSKYSQKISEACRAKQLDKVMEYNNHELAYINKLSKYFNNQKGGASAEQIIAVIERIIEKRTNELEEEIRNLKAELTNKIEEIKQLSNLFEIRDKLLGRQQRKNEELSEKLGNEVEEHQKAKKTIEEQSSELDVCRDQMNKELIKNNELQRTIEEVREALTILQQEQEQQQLRALQTAQGQEIAQTQLQQATGELAEVKKKLDESKSKFVEKNIECELFTRELEQVKLTNQQKDAESLAAITSLNELVEQLQQQLRQAPERRTKQPQGGIRKQN